MCAVLSEADREEIWSLLSEFFVDNETDFDDIAKKIAAIRRDPEQIENILFTEVAPCCATNLMTPVPPIWTGFERTSLIEEIRKMQARNQNSAIARLRHRGFAFFCRWYFREEWQRLAAALAR
ncbi:MAG: hypothetical protein LBD68_11005 [Zoogloeaceae bacterium]|jgi:hypothetical protein|nr:hypothetical protein [Zoogloeaceae bacterium]